MVSNSILARFAGLIVSVAIMVLLDHLQILVSRLTCLPWFEIPE